MPRMQKTLFPVTQKFIIKSRVDALDTEVGSYEMNTEGTLDNRLFLPGQRGWRKISNEYKYAPLERYPDL